VCVLEHSVELEVNLSTLCEDPVMATDNSMAFYYDKSLKGKKKKIPCDFPIAFHRLVGKYILIN